MGRTIKPLKNKVIVRQDPPKEKQGGLYLPQNSRELYEDVGTIEAIGSDIKLDVKVGDRVLFKRRPASVLEGFENLLLLLEEDLLAVVTDE